jgi:hypothetical protein
MLERTLAAGLSGNAGTRWKSSMRQKAFSVK